MPEPIATEPSNPLWQPPAWLPPALLLAIGAAMLSWNPDGWIHPLVDYGRELYVPWRITAGEVLYRDIAYFNGPLSPYFNALWFQLCTNMHVLSAVNVAIAGAVCWMLYRLLHSISDRFTATLAAAMFLFFFVFQHIDYLGNFNWVGPYSHEMTHGVALSLLAVCLLLRRSTPPGAMLLAGVGLVLGAIFLTKPEIFLAAGLAIGTALWAGWYRQEASPRRLLLRFGTVAGAALAPPLLAFGLLALELGSRQSLIGVLGGWVYVFQEQLTSLRFYAVGRGTDDLALSFWRITQWLGFYAAFVLPGLGLALLLRRDAGYRNRTITLVLALWPIPASLLIGSFVVVIRPVLPFTLAIAAVLAVKFWRHRQARTMRGLVLCALALGLLPKILLNVRFVHYGFGLGFPATLLCVVALLYWIPTALNRRGLAGGVFRGLGSGLLLLIFLGCLPLVARRFSEKTLVTGGEHETLHCRSTNYAEPAAFAIDWLLKNTSPEQTVVVLPEGVSINYFARRRNPTGQISFMPPEMIMYGEDQVLARLQAAPPDYCVVVHRDTNEYDLPLFGTHYGIKIMRWVGSNYEAEQQLGEEPLHPDRLVDKRPGMLIMRRR